MHHVYLMRRLFIVDSVILLSISLLGYIFYPDVPEIVTPFYLTKNVCTQFLIRMSTLTLTAITQEVAFAQKKMEHEGR